MTKSAQEVRALCERATEAGATLWHAPVARRTAFLSAAFASLREGPLYAEAMRDLPESTGLSAPMVRWALESALAPLTHEGLLALDAAATPPTPRARRVRFAELCAVVLAGNVFTAGARALALPLLFGLPVVVKPSSHEPHFVALLKRALDASDPKLGAALQIVNVASRDVAATEVLLRQADCVIAYGSDATQKALRDLLTPAQTLLAHGHGLGAAFVGPLALRDEHEASRAAEALALDVAAYDQRGCMSPQICFCTQGGAVSPARFAELVYAALGALAESLPRGPLPLDEAGPQLAFRGAAAVRGELLEGDGYAVAYEGTGALRLSPGYRNLLVLDVEGPGEVSDRLRPLGVHLKCLGVAGVERLEQVANWLAPRLAPRICPLGRMQTPKLDSIHDGLACFDGLLRYAEVDPDPA